MSGEEGFEIDFIVGENGRGFVCDGEEPSVARLPAAATEAKPPGRKKRSREKTALVALSSAAVVALFVGLGAGLGTRKGGGEEVSSAAGAGHRNGDDLGKTLEQCLAEERADEIEAAEAEAIAAQDTAVEEFESYSITSSTASFSTAASTSTTGSTESQGISSDQDSGDFFPIFDDIIDPSEDRSASFSTAASTSTTGSTESQGISSDQDSGEFFPIFDDIIDPSEDRSVDLFNGGKRVLRGSGSGKKAVEGLRGTLEQGLGGKSPGRKYSGGRKLDSCDDILADHYGWSSKSAKCANASKSSKSSSSSSSTSTQIIYSNDIGGPSTSSSTKGSKSKTSKSSKSKTSRSSKGKTSKSSSCDETLSPTRTPTRTPTRAPTDVPTGNPVTPEPTKNPTSSPTLSCTSTLNLPSGLSHLWSGEFNADDSIGSADGVALGPGDFPPADALGPGGVPLAAALTPGTILYTPSGIRGSAFRFDGVTHANLAKFDLDTRPSAVPLLTVGMWVNLAAVQPGSGNALVLSNGNGGFDRSLILDDARYSGGVSSSSGANPEANHEGGAGVMTRDAWECVAVVWDQTNSTARSYRYDPTTDIINASPLQPTAFDPTNAWDFTTLGGNPSFADNDMAGLVDEVFVYENLALGADDIETACKEVIKCTPGGDYNDPFP